jgi:hypothetical protein
MPDTGVIPDLVENRPVKTAKGGLSTAAQAGIGVASGVAVAILAFAIWYWRHKKRKQSSEEQAVQQDETGTYVRPKAELDATSRNLTIAKPELAVEDKLARFHDFAKADLAEADSSVLLSGRSTSELQGAHVMEADAGWTGHAELPTGDGHRGDGVAFQKQMGLHELP